MRMLGYATSEDHPTAELAAAAANVAAAARGGDVAGVVAEGGPGGPAGQDWARS
ncbi:MAG: hypothetical protein OXC00_16615 [Acidimicrobiaceae bacterium]|nr:hypothetical protein [Acidimicrobiaceae bacterium]